MPETAVVTFKSKVFHSRVIKRFAAVQWKEKSIRTNEVSEYEQGTL